MPARGLRSLFGFGREAAPHAHLPLARLSTVTERESLRHAQSANFELVKHPTPCTTPSPRTLHTPCISDPIPSPRADTDCVVRLMEGRCNACGPTTALRTPNETAAAALHPLAATPDAQPCASACTEAEQPPQQQEQQAAAVVAAVFESHVITAYLLASDGFNESLPKRQVQGQGQGQPHHQHCQQQQGAAAGLPPHHYQHIEYAAITLDDLAASDWSHLGDDAFRWDVESQASAFSIDSRTTPPGRMMMMPASAPAPARFARSVRAGKSSPGF